MELKNNGYARSDPKSSCLASNHNFWPCKQFMLNY